MGAWLTAEGRIKSSALTDYAVQVSLGSTFAGNPDVLQVSAIGEADGDERRLAAVLTKATGVPAVPYYGY